MAQMSDSEVEEIFQSAARVKLLQVLKGGEILSVSEIAGRTKLAHQLVLEQLTFLKGKNIIEFSPMDHIKRYRRHPIRAYEVWEHPLLNAAEKGGNKKYHPK